MVAPSIELALELQTAVIIVSRNPWRVHSFNATARKWLGEALNADAHISEILLGINEKALRRRLVKGRDARFDYDLEISPGIIAPVEFVCTLTSGLEEGVILEGSEQTRAKSAELMLSSYSQMIEEKTQELEAAIQARDHFFSTMSHELRTPLNAILGFSESLIDEIYGDLTPEQDKVIKKIYISGQNLMSLLSNLLNLSRIRSGKLGLVLESVNLQEICQESISRFKEELEDKSLKVVTEYQDVGQPLIDPLWAHQLIDHLISNAIKFSEEESSIGVHISGQEQSVRVTVWDEGIGIPAQYLNKIFQPFVQVDSSLSRSYEGSGLGLSVVAEVMRLHRGVVSVESKLNRGSQFHLDFML